jgi:cardiolipin synthase
MHAVLFGPVQGTKALGRLMLILLLSLNGCTSLPDYQVLHRVSNGNRAPQVVGENGPLSPRQSAAVLTSLAGQGGTELLQRHLKLMQQIEGAPPLTVANSVRLLIDGPATHKAMRDAIASARDHINLESYIFEDDTMGRQVADLLLEKRARGVEVNVIYDGVGAISTPAEFFARLKQGGVHVCEFNPINPLKGKSFELNHRDHRKILVVDGKVAFTGGINISSVYSTGSSGRLRKHDIDSGWRDTHIEIRGPAVAEFQKMFLDTWHKQNCQGPAARNYFPVPERRSDKVVRVIGSSPDDEISYIYAEMLSAIVHAGSSIHITMAYFVPDPQMIEALKQAAQRGVDVKLILPGFSDMSVAFYAGRSYYADLLEAGVKIYERRDALLHAKTAVIDGVWSTVGSANMDWRSFLHNDEINAVVLGESFAQEMERMFETDLGNATALDQAQWDRRGALLRFKEWASRLWEYWL